MRHDVGGEEGAFARPDEPLEGPALRGGELSGDLHGPIVGALTDIPAVDQPSRSSRTLVGRYTPGTMAKTEERPQVPIRTVDERIEELRKRKTAMLDAQRKEALRKQHERGKLSARERLELLLDPRSFQETDPFAVHPSPRFMTSGWSATGPPGTAWSRVMGRSTGGRCSSHPRTSRCSGARSARCTPRRSARSWTWRCRRAPRSSR